MTSEQKTGIEQTWLANNRSTILLIAPVVLLFLVACAADFNGLYGQDSHAYLQFSENWRDHLLNGTPKIPFFWPEGYPASGAILSLTGIGCLWALRLISLFSLIGSLLLAKSCIRFLWKKDATGWLLLAAVTQIYFVRSGFLVMSDMLCAFLILTAIYAMLLYRETKAVRFWILLLLASAVAFFVRYGSVVILLVPIAYSTWLFLMRLRVPVRAFVLLLGIGTTVLVVMFNNHFLAELFSRGGAWTLKYVYERTITGNDGTVTNTVPNGLYIFGNFFHPGFLSCGVLLLPFYKKMDRNSWLILLTTGVYLVFLAGLNTQNYRFLVLAHLPVVIALFPAFQSAFEQLRKPFLRWGAVVGILAINGLVGWYSFRKMWAVHAFEKTMAREIKAISSGEPIYSFYIDQSFPSYGIHNEVRNFFMEDYPVFEKGALVVFNEKNFAVQWKGHRVMRNWERLQEHYQLDTIRKMENNWTIYRIR